jgi:hypothetical protein
VRLELKAFERRFVVEAEDERFAVAFLEQRMTEAMLGLPEGVTVDANDVPRSLGSQYPPRPALGPHEAHWLQGNWSPERTGDGVG